MNGCDDCRAKDEVAVGLANRLTAAASVLGQLAERDGRVCEIMRLRASLERIANGEKDVVAIAEEALRWSTASS